MKLDKFIQEFFHDDHRLLHATTPQLLLLFDTFPDADLRKVQRSPLLCGRVTPALLPSSRRMPVSRNVCTEFLLPCGIARPDPCRCVAQLLLHYASKERLVFIRGDASSPEDLGRARCDSADCVFILTDVSAEDQDKEDEMAVLRALMVRRVNPFVRVYTQMLQPENEHHMVHAGIKRKNIMCHNQMRLSLLGFGVVCPGLPALLINMLQSINWRQSLSISTWQEEYCNGMIMEMYHFKPRADLIGTRFGSLVLTVKEKANGILFAIAKTTKEEPPAKKYSNVNPLNVISKAVAGMKRGASQRESLKDGGRSGRGGFGKMDQLGSKRNLQQSFKRVVRRRGSTDHSGSRDDVHMDEERMLGVLFNPGPDYVVQEGDTLFVLAEDSSTLMPFRVVEKAASHWVTDLFPSIASMRQVEEERKALQSLLASEESKEETAEKPVSGTGIAFANMLQKIHGWGSVTDLDSNGKRAAGSPAAGEKESGVSTINGELATSGELASVLAPPVPIERPSDDDDNPKVWSDLERSLRTRHDELEASCKRVYLAVDSLLSSVGDAYGVKQQSQISDAVRGYAEQELRVATTTTTHLTTVLGEQAPLRSLDMVLVGIVPRHVRGHVVVTCATMDDMMYFLAPVHARNRLEQDNDTVTVFVVDKLPTLREWEEAGVYPNVYVMLNAREGGGYMRDLLLRAGADRAQCMVFSADMSMLGKSHEASDSYVLAGLLDGLYVTVGAPKVWIISELSQGGCNRKQVCALMKGRQLGQISVESRIRSFNLMEGMQHMDNDYVSGNSVSTDLLYLLVCQLYFNPYILAIYQQILLGHQTDRETAVQHDGSNVSDGAKAHSHSHPNSHSHSFTDFLSLSPTHTTTGTPQEACIHTPGFTIQTTHNLSQQL